MRPFSIVYIRPSRSRGETFRTSSARYTQNPNNNDDDLFARSGLRLFRRAVFRAYRQTVYLQKTTEYVPHPPNRFDDIKKDRFADEFGPYGIGKTKSSWPKRADLSKLNADVVFVLYNERARSFSRSIVIQGQ